MRLKVLINFFSDSCPTGWIPKGDFCYFCRNSKVSYDTAVDYCKEFGGNLVSITDEDENKFVHG